MYPRKPNTDANGHAFTQPKKDAVWYKGKSIPGYDSNKWRRDSCGNAMKYSEYGNTASKYGWEIDHIVPVSSNGTDNLANLQPLHWENNRKKSDLLQWACR